MQVLRVVACHPRDGSKREAIHVSPVARLAPLRPPPPANPTLTRCSSNATPGCRQDVAQTRSRQKPLGPTRRSLLPASGLHPTTSSIPQPPFPSPTCSSPPTPLTRHSSCVHLRPRPPTSSFAQLVSPATPTRHGSRVHIPTTTPTVKSVLGIA